MAAAGTGIVKAAASSSGLAGTKRTKLVQVGQHYIDRLVEERKVNPNRSFPVWSPENIAKAYEDQPEIRNEMLSLYAEAASVFKKGMERDDAILKQYYADGSAFVEVEISDDDN